MSNPYDSASRVNSGPLADVFDQSLTQHQQRIDALKAVRTARDVLRMVIEREARCVERARADITCAEQKAASLGAYDLLPESLRPAARVS